MAKCKFCGKGIKWSYVHGIWYPVDWNGHRHNCYIKRSFIDFPLKDAVCIKCWKPLISNRQQCNCIEPVLTNREEARRLRSQFERTRRETEKAKRLIEKHKLEKAKLEKENLLKKARLVFKCVFCGSEAIQVENLIMCTEDLSHVFPSDYYGGNKS